jgi:hypothetical protein
MVALGVRGAPIESSTVVPPISSIFVTGPTPTVGPAVAAVTLDVFPTAARPRKITFTGGRSRQSRQWVCGITITF